MASIDDLVTVGNTLNKNLAALIGAVNRKFPDWVDVPVTASSPGTPGQVAYEPGFLYVCVSSGVWERATLATF